MSNLKGNHVSSIPSNAFNLWDDAFVQSMDTPYTGSEYRERVETLVKEVKMLLKEMQSGDGDADLIERLEMVDALQCLGIDRYFEAEIKEALHYVYRAWNESVGIGLGCQSGSPNLNATSLGLRLLRLHRYDVSADTLKNFKHCNGEFILCGENNDNNENNSKDENAMRSALNLLRVSSVGYPGEAIMEEARVFSTVYLRKLLQNSGDTDKRSFLKEVEYALIYDWPRTFTRWEARNFIEIYELHNQRLKDKKILELAKLDFNILQSKYKLEMKTISSWWEDSGISTVIVLRERSIESLFWAVSSTDELQLSSSRIALAKSTAIITIVDDIFDDYGTLEQLKCIVEAIVQGWDVSLIKSIPNNLKTCVEFVFKTIHELTSDATKKQGRDMMPFVTKAWEDYIDANMEHARWKSSGHIPTYNEYLTIASTSAAIGPILMQPILLAGPILSNESIEKMFLNKSRFYELIWMCIRLIDDTRDFKDDKRHGEIASSISSYMRDHPECSEVEALNHITNFIEELLKELRWIYLKPDNSLLDWEKMCFDFNRGLQFLYIFGDGITYSHKEVKHQVFKVFVDPVVI